MPLLVTEFGVPSSLGSAHHGPLGRDQGDHTEQEAMRMDADLMRMIQDQGLARRVRLLVGRRVVQADLEHHGAPGRRAPPALARPADQRAVVRRGRHRPGEVADGARELGRRRRPLEYVCAAADASYVHLDVTGRDATPAQDSVLVDTLPGGGRTRADYRVVVDRDGRHRAGVRTPRAGPDPARHARADHYPEGAGAPGTSTAS